jgi:hypothetical protein
MAKPSSFIGLAEACAFIHIRPAGRFFSSTSR